MLNGIDIQYLNGIDSPTRPRRVANTPQWQHKGRGGMKQLVRDKADHRALDGIITASNKRDLLMRVKSQQKNIDAVVNGVDFAGMTACSTLADQEKVRNYLIRTKEIIDTTPELMRGYRNPQQFSEMIDYVLRYWDSASREQAIELMARQEKLLVAKNKIVIEDQGKENDEFNGRFFGLLAQLMLPKSEIAKILSPLLTDDKNRIRAAQSAARRETVDSRGLKTTVTDGDQVGALCGIGDVNAAGGFVDYVFSGFEGIPVALKGLGYAGIQPYDCNRGYLTALSGYLASHIDDLPDNQRMVKVRTQERALNAFSDILNAWEHSPQAAQMATQYHREHSQDDPMLHGMLGALDGCFWNFLKATVKVLVAPLVFGTEGIYQSGKLLVRLISDPKNAGRHFGDFGKAIWKSAKTFVNNTWTGIQDMWTYGVVEPTKKFGGILKKVVKFIIRYNPLTLAIRGILLLCAKKNWFNLATKCYGGTLSEEEAAKCGYDHDDWENSKDCFKKFWNPFEKIGGRKEKLISAITAGAGKNAVGSDTPSYNDVKSLVENKSKENSTEVEASANAEYELDKQYAEERNGFVDVTDSIQEGEVVEVTAEAEIQHNKARAKKRTELWYNPNVTNGLPTTYVNEGSMVVYDMNYDDPMGKYMRVTYGNYDGYVLKADLEDVNKDSGKPAEGLENEWQLGDPIAIIAAVVSAVGMVWGIVSGCIGFKFQKKSLDFQEQQIADIKAANDQAEAEYNEYMQMVQEEIAAGIRNPDGTLKSATDGNKSASNSGVSPVVKWGAIGLGVLGVALMLLPPNKDKKQENITTKTKQKC